MSKKAKEPAWRKRLYQPQPPRTNLSEITPEEADAQEEARLARGLPAQEAVHKNEEL